MVNADGSTTSWSYDAAYRLTGETDTTSSGSTTYQASYSYDAVGNRTSATINGQATTYTYNSLDQLTSTSAGAQYSYDGRGNLAQITNGSSITSYSYDAADRLTGVTLPNGTSASYAYDAAGRRVQQTSGSTITNYLWDEASTYGDVVQETAGSGVTQASYVLGDNEVLAQTRGGAVSYYLYDGQGNVRALVDGNGSITDSYTYDAFGNALTIQGATVNPYRYTGQQLDSLTGLYDLRARYYDPTSGRFLSRDTADIDFSNITELNRYSYAQDDPVDFVDPSGQEAAPAPPPPEPEGPAGPGLAEYAALVLAAVSVGVALGLYVRYIVLPYLNLLLSILKWLQTQLKQLENEILAYPRTLARQEKFRREGPDFTIYRELGSKTSTSPSNFRITDKEGKLTDGVSFFEKAYLPHLNAWRLPVAATLVGVDILPLVANLNDKNNYLRSHDCLAQFTPRFGGNGHWSVNCLPREQTPQFLSQYAKDNKDLIEPNTAG